MPTFEQICRIAHAASIYNIRVPIRPVCCDHQSPGLMLAQLYYDRPSLVLWQGPRGGGKSFLTGYSAKCCADHYPRFEAKILGGSLAQSRQIYEALHQIRDARPEIDTIEDLLATEARFRPPDGESVGATVEILPASSKSVRGPHVPQLYIDEIDEIDEDVREGAIGMAMQKHGLPASIVMTSTWHKVAGPMAALIRRGREGQFPVGVFCAFDILERCPTERSGPNLENCPACPLYRWCHSDRDKHPSGLPKAKRSCGHYAIDSLIQKVQATSRRVFESDYLCMEPRPQGMWFKDFDREQHVSNDAEYRPQRGSFHVAIDPGNCTGAVWFQSWKSPSGTDAKVWVFGDYYSENIEGGAEANGRAIVRRTEQLTGQPIGHGTVSMDPAGRARTAVGVTVLGEYKRADCLGRQGEVKHWPEMGVGRGKADQLAILEAMLLSADGTVSIWIHPRCERLIEAMMGYVRAQSHDGQWLDHPKDPQHPHEELVDSLTGGLTLEMPRGRAPQEKLREVHARDLYV